MNTNKMQCSHNNYYKIFSSNTYFNDTANVINSIKNSFPCVNTRERKII